MLPRASSTAPHTAYTALTWVVLFLAAHVYWYLGGSVGNPGELPGMPRSPVAWAFAVLVTAAFPIAVFACLAIARGWAHGPLALVAGTIVWIGCVLLLLRGGAGVVDDLSRATGFLPNGLTGLSLEQTTGTANPTASMLWAGWAIDAYFLIGGIIFGALAVHYHTKRSAPDHG